MMNRLKYFLVMALIGAGLLMVGTETAQAQRRGGRGSGGSGNNWSNYVPGLNNSGGGYYYGNSANYGYSRYPGNFRGYPGPNNYSYSYYPPQPYGYSFIPSNPPITTYVVPDGKRPASLEIRVSDPNAIVKIDGQSMGQSGTMRVFQTPPVEPGYVYSYQVQVESPNMGVQERTVSFRAGERVNVDFAASPGTTATPSP
jgi:uncharacterized protein (TIGR03000 family)